MKFLSFISFAIVFVAVSGAPSVNITFLTESGCPNCRDYARDVLVPALTGAKLWDYVYLDVISWGNAYTETTLCPSRTPGTYDVDVRKCWNSKCVSSAGPEVEKKCFGNWPNDITCQHGQDECTGNRIEACAIGVSRTGNVRTSMAGYKFFACFVGDHGGSLKYAKPCAETAGIDWNDIDRCFRTTSGDAFLLEAAKRTNDLGPHPGVPYVRVNGKVVDDDLIAAICEEIPGEKPPTCPKAFKPQMCI